MFSKTYDKLYLNILEIGSKEVNGGLSYNDLKKHLINKGYDFNNDCIELAVKQWFYDSFTHQGREKNPHKKRKHLENHLDCNFILKGDASLRLIEYKTAKHCKWTAIYSLIIALFAIGITVYQNTNSNDKEEIINGIIEMQKSQQLLLKQVGKENCFQSNHQVYPLIVPIYSDSFLSVYYKVIYKPYK